MSDIGNVFAFSFLFRMGLAEFGGDLFDVFGDFSGFVHDIDECRTFCTYNQSKFNVIFLLFIFILDKETDDGRLLLCENGPNDKQKGNEDM